MSGYAYYFTQMSTILKIKSVSNKSVYVSDICLCSFLCSGFQETAKNCSSIYKNLMDGVTKKESVVDKVLAVIQGTVGAVCSYIRL